MTEKVRKVSRLTHNAQTQRKTHTTHIHIWYLTVYILLVLHNIQEETHAR